MTEWVTVMNRIKLRESLFYRNCSFTVIKNFLSTGYGVVAAFIGLVRAHHSMFALQCCSTNCLFTF